MIRATAYPLCWPAGFPRKAAREKGSFRTSLSAALGNVEQSLTAFGRDSRKAVSGLVMSSNVTLGAQRPDDPGVAVWFDWDGLGVCIAVDRYTTVEANLQAIHHIIEARRTELRHGTLALVRATFQGFVALPAPKSAHEILGVKPGASRDEIEAAFRARAKFAHPDHGGSDAAMAELNRARQEALRHG